MVHLQGKDFHYLVRVRRVQPGSVLNAILPDGTPAELSVISLAGDVLTARCSRQHFVSKATVLLPPIYLFQALPKGAKMDLIVRQAAETGISEVVPFLSEFSQIRGALNSRRRESTNQDETVETAQKSIHAEKFQRWDRIVKEARQQSGSEISTAIKNLLGFDEMLDYWKKLNNNSSRGLGILFHHDPLEPGTLHDYLGNNPGFVVLAVGPEGGFSPEEADRFMAAGFKPYMMGNNVLRTETAALYGTAAVKIILTESKSWLLKKNPPLSAGDGSLY